MTLIHRRYPSISTTAAILIAIIVALGVILAVQSVAGAADRGWLQGSQEITIEVNDDAEPILFHAFVLDAVLAPNWRFSYVWEQANLPAWSFDRVGLQQDVSVTWYPGGRVYWIPVAKRRCPWAAARWDLCYSQLECLTWFC